MSNNDLNFEYLGSFIRSFRSAKGESLQSLAERSGVSKSMIAQIESSKTSPTLAVLAKLAHAMDIALGDFVQPPEQAFNVRTNSADESNIVSKKDSVFVCHLLANEQRHFATEVYRFYFKEPGKTMFSANYVGSVKHVWLEEGSLTVHIADKSILIAPQTLTTFNASVPHRFESPTHKLAKGLFFIAY
ncbi:helix-turn-helix domain-containing protein [Pseudoalteromonas xiamenensis]|uniref:Helix-turn-helix domain-containing protein n=1 Tax=Pseudoalteromonas xiamenensis TaxID=882626 RepID=A0A975DLK2_9GAMM|nr:helix-turn-helix transcriptional regulator [Pseudoalteromonas xiamenensis]QTH73462.1 helix-turn-helix domain-containing protein [Pseudoalteromonas xiamenensis]